MQTNILNHKEKNDYTQIGENTLNGIQYSINMLIVFFYKGNTGRYLK